MLRNLSTSLLRHEHLVTTVPRAKELRPYVERLITIAKRGVVAGDATAEDPECAPSCDAGHPGPRGRVEAVRHPGATLRVACGRIHPPAASRLPQGRLRRDRAGRTGRQRVQPQGARPKRKLPRLKPRRSRRASAAVCVQQPNVCAEARRTKAASRRRRRRHPSLRGVCPARPRPRARPAEARATVERLKISD